MLKARKYVLVNPFKGQPKESDVKIVEEDLEPIKDGEYLVEALYLSVDPYMRLFMNDSKECLEGSQVARVLESMNEDFPVGSLVVGDFGWRTLTVVTANHGGRVPPYLLPEIGHHPASLAFGILGMPGNTVYFALKDHLKPKSGETILISGAAGAVGSHVGQIAKLKGCKVIGLAGTDLKCKWLMDDLGFDYAFNYKTINLDKALSEHVPQGLDMYFDNVGSDTIIDAVLDHMNYYGRIVLVGGISKYNEDPNSYEKVKPYLMKVLMKGLTISSIHIFSYVEDDMKKWHEGVAENVNLLMEGKLKYREHVTEGFENMFDAFLGMMRGENTGKAVVRI